MPEKHPPSDISKANFDKAPSQNATKLVAENLGVNEKSSLYVGLRPERETVDIAAGNALNIKVKDVTPESSDADKKALIDQRQEMAIAENRMKNDLTDAATLLASEKLSHEERSTLEKQLNSLQQNFYVLRDGLVKLRERYADVLKKPVQSPAEVAVSKTASTEAPQVAAQETKRPHEVQARKLVNEFLRGGGEGILSQPRISIDDQENVLQINYYEYKPNTSKPELDQESISKKMVRGNFDFGPESAIVKQFGSLEGLLKRFEPVLMKVTEKALNAATTSSDNPKSIKAQIEQDMAYEMSQILYAFTEAYQVNSLVPNYKASNMDVRGVALAVDLMRKEKRGDKKAARLHLNGAPYLNRELTRLENLDEDALNDIRVLKDSVGTKTSEKDTPVLIEAYAPISDHVVHALERFVTDDGEIITPVSADEITNKFINTANEYGAGMMPDIRRNLKALDDLKRAAEYSTNKDAVDAIQRELNNLNTKIESFLSSVGKSKLEDVIKISGKWGFGVGNQPELDQRDKFLESKKQIEARLSEAKAKIKDGKPPSVSGSRESIETEIATRIESLGENFIELKMPQLGEEFAREDEQPKMRILLGADVFKPILESIRKKTEPFDTLETRLVDAIKARAQEITKILADETATVIEKFTSNLDAAETLLKTEETSKDVTDAVVAYIQGRMYKKSTDQLGIHDTDRKTFYIAGQESRRKQDNPNEFRYTYPANPTPEALKSRVNDFGVLDLN